MCLNKLAYVCFVFSVAAVLCDFRGLVSICLFIYVHGTTFETSWNHERLLIDYAS